ncbi:MAG: hypothetical protein Q9207_006184 [Kuettlingeria erythrocarpa]
MLSKRAAVLYKQDAYTLAFANEDLEKAILLRSLLDNLYSNIQPVIQELKAPNTSKAFDTFFKDPANKDFVTTVFQNVAASACLCPFFDAKPPNVYGDTPPASVNKQPASNCLKVNAVTNNFRKASPRSVRQPAGFTLAQYRSWILPEELAHLYYQAAKRERGLDEYNVNRARKLSAQKALINGPTYSYYAAGEFSSLSARLPSPFLREANTNDTVRPAAVAGNCDDFPIKIKGHELLEVVAGDPEEVAEFVADDPMYEYGATVEVSDIQWMRVPQWRCST